jgi:hypothetical protein
MVDSAKVAPGKPPKSATPPLHIFMNFSSWERRRRHGPEADRIVPLVAAAGQIGMNRKQLGAAIKLDGEILDQLLQSFVDAGLLVATREHGGGLLFRVGGGVGSEYGPMTALGGVSSSG